MRSFTHWLTQTNSRLYGLLILLPILVYLKGLNYPFSPMDEQWLIANDAAHLAKWSYLLEAFHGTIQGIYYRPLLTVSLVLDYHLGELDPLVYHVSNLLWHMAATLLLFRLLLLLDTEKTTAVSLALLFSVHPVLAHAVEWIPGRNDAMLCVFSLLACMGLICYLKQQKGIYLAVHLLSFALALLTKENALMLPFVFLIFIFIYRRTNTVLWLLPAAWLIAAAGWYYLRQSVISYVPSGNKHLASTLQDFFLGLLAFVGKAIFPVQQSVSPTPANVSAIAGLAALVLLAFLYFKFGVKNKQTAFTGLAFFVILLVLPVWYGALSPLGEQYEHRLYTPLCGLIIFLSQLNFRTSKAFGYIAPAIVVVFAAKTFLRIDVYKNTLSYLNEGIDDCPQNYIFFSQKGNLLYEQHDLPSALDCFNKAIQLNPTRPQLFQNRGNVYLGLHKKQEAIDDYSTALKLFNNNPVVLLTRCGTYNQFNDIEHAMSDLRTMKACCSDMVPPALEREIAGKWVTLQFKNINDSLAKNPTNAELYVNRAQLYFNRRMGDEALADLKKACELQPNNARYKGYYEQLRSTYKR